MLINCMAKLETDNNPMQTVAINRYKEQLHKLCPIHMLANLSSEQNAAALEDILRDVRCRKEILSLLLKMAGSLEHGRPGQVPSLSICIDKSKKVLKRILTAELKLNHLRENLKAIQQCIVDYDNCLRDDKFKHIPSSKLIRVLETLRIGSEQLEIKSIFSIVIQLKNKWENDHGVADTFKPKIIELFKAVEEDLKKVLSNYSCIYTIPYKVGVIGYGSVGKSTLIKELGHSNKLLSSMMSIKRSTFGYLEFNTNMKQCLHSDKIIPFTFIDIQGATDSHDVVSAGNYLEIIAMADCDLYLLVFEKPFDDDYRKWQVLVKNDLHRQCLLVRSKADELFLKLFEDMFGMKYSTDTSESYDVKLIQSEATRCSRTTYDEKNLSDKVYLTAANCDVHLRNAPFATFDMDELRSKILQKATEDLQRIHKLAILAASTTINTCFRLGYIVSKMRYQIMAAISCLIPFLDQVPVFIGCEEIRQALGIHDSSAITNTIMRTTNSFEEYLIKHYVKVPKDYLKSGHFKYLTLFETPEDLKQSRYTQSTESHNVNSQSTSGITTSVRVNQGKLCASAVVLAKTAGDGARIVAPTASMAGAITAGNAAQHAIYVSKGIETSFVATQAIEASKSIKNVWGCTGVMKTTDDAFRFLKVTKTADDAARVYQIIKTADSATRVVHATQAADFAARASSVFGAISAVLIPISAAWSFYSTGQRINEHLDEFCNDLLCIVENFVITVCNDCQQNARIPIACEYCLEITQLSELSSSDEERYDTSTDKLPTHEVQRVEPNIEKN